MRLTGLQRILRRGLVGAALAGVGFASAPAFAAAPAPAVIKVGTLYADSGAFSSISMPVYQGLKLWVQSVNAKGGVYVKPYGKKIPVKLVSYNDQSSTSTATTLYNQLITQDKVNILVADSGSVLTSVAVPIAREHKVLLFNQSGTGTNLFSDDNKYNVLLDDPSSSIWPRQLADFVTNEATKHGISKVAILYSTNDFTGAQAKALHGFFDHTNGKVKVVYYHGVPTSTSNYAVLLHQIQAAQPGAVIELGYPDNDIAFLKALRQSGMKFPMTFAVYPGLSTDLMQKTAGVAAIKHVFSYVTAVGLNYKPNFGMNINQFKAAYKKMYGAGANIGFNSIAGYNTGLVIQKALNTTTSMDQLALRKAVFAQSGKLLTLDGAFKLKPDGMQAGELMPVGQVHIKGNMAKVVPVYPASVAKSAPIWGHS